MTSEASRTLFESAAIERVGEESPYHQIVRLVHDAVVDGRLRTGTKLPAERELARLLGVGRATVARALTELGDTGLLERRVGYGTVVAFDAATWRAGPTPGIPWGALLTAFVPPSAHPGYDPGAPAPGSVPGANVTGVADRGADSSIVTAGLEDGTRFLVDALVAPGDRVIVEAPLSAALKVSLTMRRADVWAVEAGGDGVASELGRLLDAQPGAKLLWLRDGSALRRRGDRAHIAGMTKRLGLPVVEEPPAARAETGLLGVEPHDHVIRVDRGWISAPAPLARLLRPLAEALAVGQTSDG